MSHMQLENWSYACVLDRNPSWGEESVALCRQGLQGISVDDVILQSIISSTGI